MQTAIGSASSIDSNTVGIKAGICYFNFVGCVLRLHTKLLIGFDSFIMFEKKF